MIHGQPEVTYGYDAANRLTSITKGTDVITLGYDNANRRTSMAMADGISVAYGYDNANRLTSVTCDLHQRGEHRRHAVRPRRSPS
jgi:YD repeat-containing protein